MMRAAPWLGVLFLLTTMAGVPAHAAATVFLDELTWPELQERIRAGTTTVIIPIGGTEQNGPHMVLGKHNVRVKVLAAKIAQALGNTLVAPVVSYVPEGSIQPPTAHMRFPGTITVPDAAFEQVIESAAKSFRLHGFRDIVLIGDHGGYQKSLAAVAARLNREWATSPARVHAVVEYYRATETASRRRSRAAVTATPRSARTRDSPTRRSRSRSIRTSSGATSSMPARAARPLTA